MAPQIHLPINSMAIDWNKIRARINGDSNLQVIDRGKINWDAIRANLPKPQPVSLPAYGPKELDEENRKRLERLKKEAAVAKAEADKGLLQRTADEAVQKTKGFFTGAADLLKSVVRAPQRALVASAIQPVADTLSVVTGKKVEPVYTPQSKTEQFFFGTEPVKSIFKQQEEIVAQQKNLQSGTEGTALEGAGRIFGNPALAPFAVAGSLAFDLIPVGSSKKIAEESLAKIAASKSADDIAKILVTAGKDLSDDAAKKLAPKLVDASTIDDVVEVIGRNAPGLFKGPVREVGENITQSAARPSLTTDTTISKLIKAIDDAVPLRGEQKKLYQEELAKRTARVAAIGRKVSGEAGFYAQLSQLKGSLPKASYEGIKKQFSQGELDMLFDAVEQSKTLLPLEKVATKKGLQNLLEGVVPTPSEIVHLREVFPKELVDSIMARQPVLEKIKQLGVEVANVPRTMMASTDLSFGLRQGAFMLGRPKQFAPAFKEQFKFFGSDKAYQGLLESIKARPTYLKMKQAGLALTDVGGELSKREEVFLGNLAEKIPLYGSLVRASGRAYTGFANKLRADIFDDLLKKAQTAGKEIDDEFLRSLGDFINAGTGRGKFGLSNTGILPKSMERAAPVVNAVFFSPRLMASRLNLLNPYFYAQLDPFVRKEALKTLFADAGLFGGIYGLWKLNGGDVEVDPRSADFGKLKIGNTRYDVLGGFQQYIKLASQLVSGEIISSTTGRTITLGEGYKPLTRKDIILRFFESKESPIASFVSGLLTDSTFTGDDFDVPTEVISRFIPMVVQDLYDISQEKGAEGLLYGLPAIFGTGVQTYGQQQLKLGKNPIGEETAEIQPVQGMAEKIRELVVGQLPLGPSRSFSVEAYYDQLSNLPRAEAADVFEKLAKSNPELANQLSEVVRDREAGITVKDKDLKSKGVSDGSRAIAVKEELDRLKNNEQKAALWNDYVRKKIITKEVARQLGVLLNAN